MFILNREDTRNSTIRADMTYPVSDNLSQPSSQPLASSEGGQAMEQEIRLEIALVADRVERLLVQHAELHRNNALLHEQVRAITADRDSLRSRLNAARARVEALIERLPDNVSNPLQTQPGALE